jgi:hypothetical protein
VKRLSRIRLAALLVLCAGCGGAEPRTNGTVAGEYVLVERDGERLPHTMTVPFQGRQCSTTLIRLVMTLRADGTWFEDGQGRNDCPMITAEGAEIPDTSDIFHSAGSYELRGLRGDSLVMIDSIVPDTPPQTGVFVRDELRMILPLAPPLDTVHFRYVRQRARE